jgi:hypothetical protein
MKKQTLILISILLVLNTNGQDLKTYSISDLSGEFSSFDRSVKSYAEDMDHKLVLAGGLNELASLRLDYFLSVIMETSRKRSIDQIFDLIPQNTSAHYRYFGSPQKFKEPCCISYPEPLIDLLKDGVRVQAEIMQENYWGQISKTELSDKEIVRKAIEKISQDFGADYILSGYKQSQHHNAIIVKYGEGKYGTSTKVLLSKKFNSKLGVWEYEVVIANCSLFSKPLR